MILVMAGGKLFCRCHPTDQITPGTRLRMKDDKKSLVTWPGDRFQQALLALSPAGRETQGELHHLHRDRHAGNINHQHHTFVTNCHPLQITWSMAGSQATPVRPLPGLPVGEIDVPRVTNGDDLVAPIIVVIVCQWRDMRTDMKGMRLCPFPV